MSREVSETFMVWDPDGDTQAFDSPEGAKAEALDLFHQILSYSWIRVYHLDFITNKMTLIKEYRRRTETDEEGIIEYI